MMGLPEPMRIVYSSDVVLVRLTVREPFEELVNTTFAFTEALKKSLSSDSSPAIVPNE